MSWYKFFAKITNYRQTGEVDRLTILTLLLLLLGGLLVTRLVYVQIIRYPVYAARAESQHEIDRILYPRRGTIYAADAHNEKLTPLATTKRFYELYAIPKEIVDPTATAARLLPFLEDVTLPADTEARTAKEAELKSKHENLVGKLSKPDDPYESLKKKVTEQEKENLQALDLKGLAFLSSDERFYPEGSLASHVLGFVGLVDERRVGQYGLEGYFEEQLRGQLGYLKGEKDAEGRWLTVAEKKQLAAQDGASLVLTLDRTLEYAVCQKLQAAVIKYQATKGGVIIMDPKNGAILAMCGYPDFDPNDYGNVSDAEVYNNLGIFEAYEPGSVFKPMTMAAALDQGVITPETTYEDLGELKLDVFTIRNSDRLAHGTQSMIEVLIKSLNLGTVFVVQKLGGETFRDYVHRFGFGELTGLELQSEVKGNLRSLEKNHPVYYSTAAYGQGITVTALQLVNAYAAIANGGSLMRPYIVKEVRFPNGEVFLKDPKIIRQVMSSRAANLLSGMLVAAVRSGHGKQAGVDGYFIAGKTGTAQVAAANGGYGEETIQSFVGFGPISDPAFVMIVRLDSPNTKFAESSAAPLFGELADFFLNYYEVPTDDAR